MRVGVLVPVAILLGAVLGVGVACWEYGITARAATPAPPKPDTVVEAAHPVAVVTESVHKFGSIEVGGKMSHTFTIENKGNAPLQLTTGTPTCKCTKFDLVDSTIPAGGRGTAKLEWKGEGEIGPFRQQAPLETNDPKNPTLYLTVEGELTEAIVLDPGEIVFSSASPRQPVSANARIFALQSGGLEITGHKFESASGDQQFEIAFSPLPMEELASRKAASGVLATVTTKPPLPLGQIQQKIVLQTNVAAKPEVGLSIKATVVSDISVMGQNWSTNLSVLRLGLVESKEGVKRELRLVTRGPFRKDIKFSVAKKVPEFLEVSFGEMVEVNQGLVTQVPIYIEVPKGSRPVNHLGSALGEMGEVIVATTHPDAKEVRLQVQFAVEE